MSIAIPAIGTLLKRGDGGVGAGTKASKTLGTSNQLLKISAKTAGTAGNAKTFGIVVAGNNTAYSQVITANSVLINSATDGSAAATTNVLQAIANLYADATFQANFDASHLPGNGSGVPRITLAIDDTDHALTDIFRYVAEAPTATIEVVTSLFPDQVERQYADLKVLSFEMDGKGIMKITMTVENLLNRRFPLENYDVIHFRGLHYQG